MSKRPHDFDPFTMLAYIVIVGLIVAVAALPLYFYLGGPK